MNDLLFYSAALALFIILFNFDYLLKEPAALLGCALVLGLAGGLATLMFWLLFVS